jgi:hypothetical protein
MQTVRPVLHKDDDDDDKNTTHNGNWQWGNRERDNTPDSRRDSCAAVGSRFGEPLYLAIVGTELNVARVA